MSFCCCYCFFWLLCSKKDANPSYITDACGGYIDQTNGTLQSPSFPELYLPNKVCVWQIVAPEQYRITLNFTHFDLEGNNVSHITLSMSKTFSALSSSSLLSFPSLSSLYSLGRTLNYGSIPAYTTECFLRSTGTVIKLILKDFSTCLDGNTSTVTHLSSECGRYYAAMTVMGSFTSGYLEILSPDDDQHKSGTK